MSPVGKGDVRDIISKIPLTSLQQWAYEIDVVQVTTPWHYLEVWSPLASTQNLPFDCSHSAKMYNWRRFFFFFADLSVSVHVFSAGGPISAPLGNRDVEIGAICRSWLIRIKQGYHLTFCLRTFSGTKSTAETHPRYGSHSIMKSEMNKKARLLIFMTCHQSPPQKKSSRDCGLYPSQIYLFSQGMRDVSSCAF